MDYLWTEDVNFNLPYDHILPGIKQKKPMSPTELEKKESNERMKSCKSSAVSLEFNVILVLKRMLEFAKHTSTNF